MKRLFFLVLLAVCLVQASFAQSTKKPLDFTQYDKWKSLSSQQVSDDGNWLVWNIGTSKGYGKLYLREWGENNDKKVIDRATQPNFSPNSDYVVFRIVPQADTVRQAKLKKVKTEKMPKDTLGIYTLNGNQMTTYANLKSFKVADESSSWLAFQQEEVKPEEKPEKKDTTAAGKTEIKEKPEKSGKKDDAKSAKKPEYKGLPLIVMNPVTRDSQNFPLVTEYNFSKHGKWLYMVSIKEDSLKTSTVRVFDTKTGAAKDIWVQVGVVKGLACDENATELAFLYSADTAKNKIYSLYHWSEKEAKPRMIVDSATAGMPEGVTVSENEGLSFSPNGQRLFFGTARIPVNAKEEKDSLLDDDKVSVDIWHWQEDVIHSMQLKQVDRIRKNTYQAVYNLKKNQMVQLGDSLFIESFRLVKQGDSDMALGFYDLPYRLMNDLKDEFIKDVYLTDLNTGNDVKLFDKALFSPGFSPMGKYLYWWQPVDSSWYCYSIKEKTQVNLTHGLPVGFTYEIHDTPDEPRSYGIMGWTDNDDNICIYDKYDIWKVDPDGKDKAVCITDGYGRKNDLSIRYLPTDPEEKFLDIKKDNLFTLKQNTNKKTGFCRFAIGNPEIRILKLDDCSYNRPTKAKSADKFIWTRSTVREYPDLWIGDASFKGGEKITNTNPQQSEYIWADAELVEWNDLDGEKHQGVFYKPENLDPTKKYPMIVYFYERHSDELYYHYTPRPSASIVNPLEYASNGYLVFMPDISFKIGLPGKSFYNAIMSGIKELEKRGYIDMKHLGIQGQSWGGYGTAYMITQTGLFAAASPGAPVSNMTSAYSGIRSESGMVRQSQYEKTQSRIGGTLWEKPEYFIENSPVFFADRITTPCLIRHDDNDGAVPFSEGVQLFAALRRLNKPAWLINYNNQPHNLSRVADKKDWSVRMMQFFDHYLKDAPAPDWMTKGVSAVNKKSNEVYYMKYTGK
ncbi:MAG: prolyl oligopeptidase family serine peptidase [Bacteroidales bacterium]|nr:prolyl oligopeptidase family serine peptidase [Bacteroidales bacterium]